MNIFSETDYRAAIKMLLGHSSASGKKRTQQELAAAMRMQPSNLSRVFTGQPDLSADQMALACRYFELPPHQTKYMQLILDLARSTLAFRRDELLGEIASYQERYLRSEKHLLEAVGEVDERVKSRYFEDPLLQLVHMCLFLPRFARHPADLASILLVSPQRLEKCLSTLVELGIIRRAGGRIEIVVNGLHLERDHPVFSVWKSRLNQLAEARALVQTSEGAYSFAALFTANEKTRAKVLALYLEFLKEVQSLCADVNPEHVYQISFQLFPWTD